jgi:hypothetical protein
VSFRTFLKLERVDILLTFGPVKRKGTIRAFGRSVSLVAAGRIVIVSTVA